MRPIVTLTVNPSIDKSTSVDRVEPDRKLRCAAPRLEPGGGGINVSRALANMGGRSVAVFMAGGSQGEIFRGLLEEADLDPRLVPIQGATRESWSILEESSRRQYRFAEPGPSVTEAEAEACLRELLSVAREPGYIVASGSLNPGLPDDFYARVAAEGRAAGHHVVVDTSGSQLGLAAEAGVHVLKCNLRELESVTSGPIQNDAELAEAARGLLRRGPNDFAVISLGTGGALLAWGDGIARFPTPTVPIVSRVGAGDSMVAGIVLGLARGWVPTEAIRLGVAAGAAAVMTPGTALCRGPVVEQLYQLDRETDSTRPQSEWSSLRQG